MAGFTIQDAAVAKQIERAEAEEVVVVARGCDMGDSPVFIVPSSEHAGCFRLVSYARGSRTLSCTCPAAQYGRACVHIGAVAAHLTERARADRARFQQAEQERREAAIAAHQRRRQARQQRPAAGLATSVAGPVEIRSYGQAELREVRMAPVRQTAMLRARTDNRPISIWK